jgi:hypothetical protein
MGDLRKEQRLLDSVRELVGLFFGELEAAVFSFSIKAKV